MPGGRGGFEVSGSGKHYVWNDDMTGMVENDGPIVASMPFFLLPDLADPPGEPSGWPEGWVDIGATVDE